MKIEVNAKILLTIPESAAEKAPEDYILEVEQYLNGLLPVSDASCLGIRVHVDGKALKVTQ